MSLGPKPQIDCVPGFNTSEVDLSMVLIPKIDIQHGSDTSEIDYEHGSDILN